MSLIHQALSKARRSGVPVPAAGLAREAAGEPMLVAWLPFLGGLFGVLAVGAVAAVVFPPSRGTVQAGAQIAPPASAAAPLAPPLPESLSPARSGGPAPEGTDLAPGPPEAEAMISPEDPFTLRPTATSALPSEAPAIAGRAPIPPIRTGLEEAPPAVPYFPRLSSVPSEPPARGSEAAAPAGTPTPDDAPGTAGAPEISNDAPVSITPISASLASLTGNIEVTGAEARPGAMLGIGSKIRSRGGAAQIDFPQADLAFEGTGSLEIRRLESRDGPEGTARNATIKVEGGRAQVVLRPGSPRDAFLVSAGAYTLSAPSGSFTVEAGRGENAPSRVTVQAGSVTAHPHDGSPPIRIEAGQTRDLAGNR